ncbi:putative beta-lysine N-acetyltransferase [Bacillus sp. NSP9.1]|uniref:putative beta-lysine N-acetyltransferase n=1 Tax=Bacillus sp. NSP9.1 TaxID=1071078 RepID=UPI00041CF654|nr:putative beta-lysine N-acetyltransferase [Bacillus sp. NSP9.1]QHZ47320.1 putative beta-lysine N-acetyltransferase [Bacillus sp. NSP9.1]
MTEKWSNEYGTLEIDLDVLNKRIRVINYEGDVASFFPDILKAAKARNLEKIIIFAKARDRTAMLEHLYEPEGQIDGYFNGHDAELFVRYVKESRRETQDWHRQDQMLETLFCTKCLKAEKKSEFKIRRADAEDAPLMAKLYKDVFPVYPAPVFDHTYLEKLMAEGTVYRLAFDENKLIAAAAADINPALGHAELTDCAVLPSYRGSSLTKLLITALEADLKKAGIFSVFSIARAASFGMNASLYHLSYRYRGRLINNCLIYEAIENMNIWCKNLSGFQDDF